MRGSLHCGAKAWPFEVAQGRDDRVGVGGSLEGGGWVELAGERLGGLAPFEAQITPVGALAAFHG